MLPMNLLINSENLSCISYYYKHTIQNFVVYNCLNVHLNILYDNILLQGYFRFYWLRKTKLNKITIFDIALLKRILNQIGN